MQADLLVSPLHLHANAHNSPPPPRPQMPIAEACHVALQRHPLDKQVVWRHMEVRRRGGREA
jgi:hypothetical protein